MDRATLDQRTRRICQATTPEALGAVPPGRARTELQQIWQLVRHGVTVGWTRVIHARPCRAPTGRARL